MWLLRNDEKGWIYRILPEKQNIVTRREGDLLLVGDQSISRKHAELFIEQENEDKGVVLKDLGSKYGTFLVGDDGEFARISAHQPITLKSGNIIRFGIQFNTWRVEYFPLMVVTSTLSAAEKTEVKQMVAALGGQVLNDWQPCCTHLTMNKLTVTVKVVCALASAKPIVMPGYWKSLSESLSRLETTLPDYNQFVPPLAEAVLNPSEVSFTPDPTRSKLFCGFTFVAASDKQLIRIKPMVTAAGGTAVGFNAKDWPESKLRSTNTILMQHLGTDKQGSQQSQVAVGYLPVARKLRAAGIRLVPESEVGLSILHRSMEKYCNPQYDPNSLFAVNSSEPTQPITIICPDTQESSNSNQSSDLKAGSSGPSISKKRVGDLADESEQPLCKKPNINENCEDMFCSESGMPKTDRNSNKVHTSSKEEGIINNVQKQRSVVDQSLDMFAPSGQPAINQNKDGVSTMLTSNITNNAPMQNHIDPSLDMFAPFGQPSNEDSKNESNVSPVSRSKTVQNKKQIRVEQSLDMFASSALPCSNEKKTLGPSCQDMFSSSGSRQGQEPERNNASPLRSGKRLKFSNIDEEDDNFSFKSIRKSSRVDLVSAEKEVEFSFPSVSNRRSTRQEPKSDDCDEFSFDSKTTRSNQRGKVKDEGDEFSFTSSTSSKKRSRQKECKTHSPEFRTKIDTSEASSNCKTENHSNFNHNENKVRDNDLFSFDSEPDAKKRKDCNSLDNVESDVKVAFLDINEDPCIVDPADDTNMVTYSKDNPPPSVKEETTYEEIDELANDLQSSTVIVVKPLVVARPKVVQEHSTVNGKNFKIFRKARAASKRTVPLIIGGSDLIPHVVGDQDAEDMPLSPPPMSPDDDWGFPKDKKRGKCR